MWRLTTQSSQKASELKNIDVSNKRLTINSNLLRLFSITFQKPEEKKSSLKYITSETSLEESSYDSEGGVGADIIKKLRSQTPSIDESTPKQDKKGSARKLSMRGRRNKSGGKPTKTGKDWYIK